MQELPAFVINLDRRPDRWESITSELKKVGISATRVSAIDGQDMAVQDVPTPFLSRAYYACTLSHYKALRQFLETGRSAALILEDDAQLAFDIPAVLRSTDWWPAGVQIMNLDTYYHGHTQALPFVMQCGRTPSGRSINPIVRYSYGAAGYLITRRGALTVLKDGRRNVPPIPMDLILFDLRWSQAARSMRPVQVMPSMVRQKSDDLVSDLESNWNSVSGKRPSLFQQVSRRILYRKILGLPYKIESLFLYFFGVVCKKHASYSETPPEMRVI